MKGSSNRLPWRLSPKFCGLGFSKEPRGLRLLLRKTPCSGYGKHRPIRCHWVAKAETARVYLEPLPARPEGARFTAAGWLAAFSLVAVAAAIIYRVIQQRKQDSVVVEAQNEFMHSNALESEEFQTVLASVRQVVTFQRVVQSMRAGDTSRAMIDLYRVLEQNALCRTPLNTANFTQEELEDVYRLHLHNSELPLQYSTLLHLRQLLHIKDQRAEELEAELKSSAYEFSI